MLNVLFICSNLVVGGVEKVCWEIVSNINRSKYHIDFLVAIDSDIEQYYEPLLKEKGCCVYKGGYIYNSADKKDFLEKERELLRLNNYDIVHSHMDFMNIWTLRVAKKQKVKKRISHVHTSLSARSEWIGINKVKYFVQCSLMPIYANVRLGCSKLANDSFYPNITSEVIKNGFDIKNYIRCGELQKKNKNIVAIGRIDGPKNPLFICEIMHELVSLDPEFVLYWIGDGCMRQQVEKMLDIYSLKDNVHLIGTTTNIFPYLEICSFAICPSFYEGLGISIVETQLAKCFTFYSDVVPKEVNIGYSMELPLSVGAKTWAVNILDFAINDKSSQFKINVEQAEQYNICNMICRLEDIYDEI